MVQRQKGIIPVRSASEVRVKLWHELRVVRGARMGEGGYGPQIR